ncbi:HCOMODA/2-hydroxy-3-carboxy-muconic semialdehyde decarboxylase [Sphingobium sp. AP50]|uniref:class II aldolase/adducin family protein n=1 Tax=Sphingobium sp. AP50 TaxID=1884369 RepID=UPI0008C2088E|nr:class II aldolase/adducin family protein [Sphingobium sp. AP50]SEK00228.1 HCOMODA/2-hydroxy-3-carboxy-muconic semialdehyde decarboxylase [Sphingobium sp. AP50]
MSVALVAQTKVSQGSRILASQGVLDAFGHVSMRSEQDPALFHISRNRAPALVAPEDVVTVDLSGNAVSQPADVRLFLERYIHAEIYRRRPDVHAVVHSHALPVLPFTVVPGKSLRPICHMCGFLEGTPAPFDLADHAGSATDLLISNAQLGEQLAEHLGKANIVLMRSHGFTAVGASVEQAVYRAIYTMKNCEIELSARALGEPIFLSSGEAEACERTIGTQTHRAWELWLNQVGA